MKKRDFCFGMEALQLSNPKFASFGGKMTNFDPFFSFISNCYCKIGKILGDLTKTQ